MGYCDFFVVYNHIVSQAIRIFPRAHARGKGGGGREGKIRLARCARFSFRLPEFKVIEYGYVKSM